MFCYSQCKIISAVPLAEIEDYLLRELGAVQNTEQRYEYAELKIEVTQAHDPWPALAIPRHTINVSGDKASAERFLTDFRFRFMSAGG